MADFGFGPKRFVPGVLSINMKMKKMMLPMNRL
jgi:hypothetical protein